MIVSGRCHGPGCQQAARVEYWCGEPCQAAWSRQFAGLTVNAPVPPQRRFIRPTPPAPFLWAAIEERMPAVREAVQAEMDRVVADTLTQVSQQQIVHTEPGSYAAVFDGRTRSRWMLGGRS